MTDWSFEETLTAKQVGELLGVSAQTVWRWADSGELVTRINPRGRGRVYSAEQVRALRGAEAESAIERRARCYAAALQRLRRIYPKEFAALYEAELAGSQESAGEVASPVSAGDAEINPVQEA